MVDTFAYDDSGLKELGERLKSLPDALRNKFVRAMLKRTLEASGAREELISALSGFQQHTGRLRKSPSPVKTSRVKNDHNRFVAYIFFRKGSNKVKAGSKRHKKLMPPRTIAHWLDAGTEPHSNRYQDRLLKADKANRIAQTYRSWIAAAQDRIANENRKAKPNQSKLKKDHEKLQRMKERLTNISSHSYSQKGRQIAGIPAHRFMEKIQSRINNQQSVILVRELNDEIIGYLNKGR